MITWEEERNGPLVKQLMQIDPIASALRVLELFLCELSLSEMHE